MATTIAAQITNQDVSSTTSYCYLYEPLSIDISESNGLATSIYIDLIVIDTETGDTVDSEVQYADFDYNQSANITIDLMRVAQQYHDANVLKIGLTSDIGSSKDIPVSKYKYQFKIYSNVDSTGQTVSKLPIIGGRDFYDFNPIVDSNQVLTEAELYNVDLTKRWLNYPNISTTLASPTSTDSTPTITISNEATADLEPCGGMLIWKSRFGGWMYWGMDIMTKTPNKSYSNNLSVGMFEANSNGNPYVQADYTKIDTSYSITLKALALKNDELKSVVGINSSIAVYYMRDSSSKLELMRVSSAAAPISTLVGGGDFVVKLSSISTSYQKSR